VRLIDRGFRELHAHGHRGLVERMGLRLHATSIIQPQPRSPRAAGMRRGERPQRVAHIAFAPRIAEMRRRPGQAMQVLGLVGVEARLQPQRLEQFERPAGTLVREGRAACGIGSGITADSSADGEWAEWTHKRAFVAT